MDMSQLRSAMLGKSVRPSDIAYEVAAWWDNFYVNIGNVSGVPLFDFFYASVTQVFFVECAERNPLTIDYLTGLLLKFTSSERLPDNHDFMLYLSDEDEGLYSLIGDQRRGDLCLFNAGILHKYHEAKHKPIGLDYFTKVGKGSFYKAAKRGIGDAEVLDSLWKNFSYYVDGFQSISSQYIFEPNNEFFRHNALKSIKMSVMFPSEPNKRSQYLFNEWLGKFIQKGE